MALGGFSHSNPRYSLGVRPASGPAPTISVSIAVEEGAYTEDEYDAVLQNLVDFFHASGEYLINDGTAVKTRDSRQQVTPTQ